MDVWVWSDNDQESFAVDGEVRLVTYQLGGAVAARQKIFLPSKQKNWVALIDGAQVEVVVSDLGDLAHDEERGIPQPPPPAAAPTNPAGMHVLPLTAGKILYVSVATPRAHTARTASGSDDPPNPAGVH